MKQTLWQRFLTWLEAQRFLDFLMPVEHYFRNMPTHDDPLVVELTTLRQQHEALQTALESWQNAFADLCDGSTSIEAISLRLRRASDTSDRLHKLLSYNLDHVKTSDLLEMMQQCLAENITVVGEGGASSHTDVDPRLLAARSNKYYLEGNATSLKITTGAQEPAPERKVFHVEVGDTITADQAAQLMQELAKPGTILKACDPQIVADAPEYVDVQIADTKVTDLQGNPAEMPESDVKVEINHAGALYDLRWSIVKTNGISIAGQAGIQYGVPYYIDLDGVPAAHIQVFVDGVQTVADPTRGNVALTNDIGMVTAHGTKVIVQVGYANA